ncbi:MAG: ChbG/HpnK family deacetylase [Elusimicrobia bacterium]|nr:ChbG/HpnK family deacetylase [Elusimicrobiota bacterium]
MKRERRLIVTADDFGRDRHANQAVERAYREGILRFASLMVLGGAAREAAAIAAANPGLGVGVHLDLCRQDPAARPLSPAAWGWRHFWRPDLADRVASEIEAQIGLCLSLGIKPTHLDSHLNVHIHPKVFPLVVAAALRHGIGRVRLTSGELGLRLRYSLEGFLPCLVLGGVFGCLAAYLRARQPAGAAAGLVFPDRTLGLLRSGMMTEDYLLWLIDRLPEGLTELYLHPTADESARAGGRPTPTHHSLAEFEALTSPRVRAALEAGGVRLAAAAAAST